MQRFETLLLAHADGVATVTLNRPAARNALSREMALELRRALDQLQADPAVRVLVLHGAGGAFCAGGDLRATGSADPRDAQAVEAAFEPFRALTLALHAFDRPLIAAAEGVAYGAGFSLLLLCDIVLLADTARLCMAFQRIGVVPDCGAMYTLPRIVGLQRAKELMLSAREVRAEEALRLGLCLEVLAPAALMPRAGAMARAFCDASPGALRLTKRGLAATGADLNDILSYEATAQAVTFTSTYLADAAQRHLHKVPRLFDWPEA